MSVTAAIALQIALLATGGDSYAEAHKATMEKGCPLVVMVGATWCPACRQMKRSVIPEIKRLGILQKVAFAEVDLDEEQELAGKLTAGGAIPQLLMYRKTPHGWQLARLVGAKDVRTVQQFIARGLSDGNAASNARGPSGNPGNGQPTRIASAPARPTAQASGTETK